MRLALSVDNVVHTFKGLECEGRIFDVSVFISYVWDEGKEDELEDFYPEVEDFNLSDVYEILPGGNQIYISHIDPIRWDILGLIDDRLDEALVGVTKQSNE